MYRTMDEKKQVRDDLAPLLKRIEALEAEVAKLREAIALTRPHRETP
jgi:hypothetical protein